MEASIATKARVFAVAESRGDERVTAMVEAHFGFVWRTLRRFGVPEADADDAAQRVFIVAADKVGRIEPGRERAFLFSTAVRVADKARRSIARRREVAPLPEEAERHPSPGIEELVDQRRARRLLDAILDELPEAMKTVFVLYEVEQLTMAEIAELLDVRPGTVASRLRRARERFFQRLDELHPPEEPRHE